MDSLTKRANVGAGRARLNDSLLLPDARAAASFRDVRDSLLREGADLEASLEMRPVEIYGRSAEHRQKCRS